MQDSLMFRQISAIFLLTSCFGCFFSSCDHDLFLRTICRWLWDFCHPCVKDLSRTQVQLVSVSVITALISAHISAHTLSSALRRISLSGKAPSRCIHWSRTSCGSERSALTGTTRDPIGWSHALDNFRYQNTFGVSVTVWENLNFGTWFINNVKISLHPPSLWASPRWGHGPKSRMSHSTEEIWSDHTPSDRKKQEWWIDHMITE